MQYYRTDINELTSKFNDDKVRFIQADLSQTIDIDKTFGEHQIIRLFNICKWSVFIWCFTRYERP